jgi:cell division protein ZipA
MNNLHWISIAIIIVLVILIIGWRYWQRRQKRRKQMAQPSEENEFYEEEEEYFEKPPAPEAIEDNNNLFASPLIERKAKPSEFDSPKEITPIDEAELEADVLPPSPSELLVVFYVVAQKSGFLGKDLLAILEDLGLKYGDMSIFHHYGLGELKVKKPIFSVANITEPGTFEPQEMADLLTPGVALFMRLPGPFGGRVAFELMLNSAKRIAETMEGSIVDERHKFLDQKKITALRERIANFEQRSVHYSMLKQFN